MKSILIIAIVLLCCTILSQGVPLLGASKLPLTKAEIKFIDENGGFYYIEASNGNKYEPAMLMPEFEVDGLKVAVSGTICTGCLSSHSYGLVLIIDKINVDK